MEEVNWVYYAVGACIGIAAVANAVMDRSSEDLFNRPWWNKSAGWKYKWKNGDREQGERFWLSSTVLVFLTDGWHMSQFVFHCAWQMAIALLIPWPILSFIVIKTMFSLNFELVYRVIKKLIMIMILMGLTYGCRSRRHPCPAYSHSVDHMDEVDIPKEMWISV